IAVTRAHDGDVIHAASRVRKQIGYLDAGATAFLEFSFAAKKASFLGNKLIFGIAKLFGTRLAIEFVQQRLGIERLQMTGTTGHEQENDRFRFALRQIRRFWCQRIRGSANRVLMQERCQSQCAEATECVSQKSASIRKNTHEFHSIARGSTGGVAAVLSLRPQPDSRYGTADSVHITDWRDGRYTFGP